MTEMGARTLFQILIDSIYQHIEKTKEVQGEGKEVSLVLEQGVNMKD